MMRYILILLTIPLLFSCGHQHDPDAAHAIEHATLAGLTLNGAERWQADVPTNASMKKLKLLLEEQEAVKESHSMEAYNSLGKDMASELQQIFKNCTMQGKEHDMLHVYLVPLMDDVKIMNGDDVAAAAEAHTRLEQRVGLYNTYFR